MKVWPVVAFLLIASALGLVGCGGSSGSSSESDVGSKPERQINVAAAADLRLAFDELGALFTQKTGTEVVFTFGSSGQLAEQIVHGAPFDVFASANVSYVDEVLESARGDPGTKQTYAFGRIVIWSKSKTYSDLEELAADRSVRHIAIANPEHAPYGVAAKEALESAGVYQTVEDLLVYGENASDTLALAESGNADVAIAPLSLATVSDGQWTLIPMRLHEPLEQALAVTAQTEERAKLAEDFVRFVSSPEGREVMRRYGFLLPGEDAPQA